MPDNNPWIYEHLESLLLRRQAKPHVVHGKINSFSNIAVYRPEPGVFHGLENSFLDQHESKSGISDLHKGPLALDVLGRQEPEMPVILEVFLVPFPDGGELAAVFHQIEAGDYVFLMADQFLYLGGLEKDVGIYPAW